MRDEFLDGEVFLSVLEGQVRLGIWRRYWNEERLHSSLGYVTPAEFAVRWAKEARKGAETKAIVVHRMGADHAGGMSTGSAARTPPSRRSSPPRSRRPRHWSEGSPSWSGTAGSPRCRTPC